MSGPETVVPEAGEPRASRLEPERESGVTLLTALLAIRRQFPVLLLLAVLGVLTGIGLGVRQPTVYSSTAMLTVRPSTPDLQLQMPPLAASYAALGKTDAVADRLQAATGATSTSEQLLDRLSVTTSATAPDIFVTAQGPDGESAKALASAWVQALTAQADSTKGAAQAGGNLVVLAPPSTGVLSSSRSIVRSSTIGLTAGLLLGLVAALGVDAVRQRGSRAAVAERRGVPVVFVARGPTSPSALDDGARVALAMLHPASAAPGRLIVVDLRSGPDQGAAADAVARILAAQGVPATVLRSSRRRDRQKLAGQQAADPTAIGTASEPVSRHPPGVTVLPVERSVNPARWALSAAGRQELAVLTRTQQVVINVPFSASRSDALAIAANAPGVIVVAGPHTHAKDFDEALGLLSAVSPKRLVAVITERSRGRQLASRFRKPLSAVRSERTERPADAASQTGRPEAEGPTAGGLPDERVGGELTPSSP